MTKVISVSDEAYTRLSKIKNRQSFSQVILRLTEQPKPGLIEVLRKWGPAPELTDQIEQIYRQREKMKIARVKI